MSSSDGLSARERCPSLCLRVIARLCHGDVASLCLRNFLTPRSLMFDFGTVSQTWLWVHKHLPELNISGQSREPVFKLQVSNLPSQDIHDGGEGWLCISDFIWLDFVCAFFCSKSAWLHYSSHFLTYSFPFHCSLPGSTETLCFWCFAHWAAVLEKCL